jgi:hypothetical protein
MMSQILIYDMKHAILWAVGTNSLVSQPEHEPLITQNSTIRHMMDIQ